MGAEPDVMISVGAIFDQFWDNNFWSILIVSIGFL